MKLILRTLSGALVYSHSEGEECCIRRVHLLGMVQYRCLFCWESFMFQCGIFVFFFWLMVFSRKVSWFPGNIRKYADFVLLCYYWFCVCLRWYKLLETYFYLILSVCVIHNYLFTAIYFSIFKWYFLALLLWKIGVCFAIYYKFGVCFRWHKILETCFL